MRRGRRDRRSTAAYALLLCLLCLGCDSGKSRVEVLSRNAKPGSVVKVAASDEAIVVIQRIADAYSARTGVRFEIFKTESVNVPEILAQGAADMGIVTRKVKESLRKTGLNYIPYAYDGAVFIASKSARVKNLSVAQLQRILEGSVVNWKEVGGADLPIHVVIRPETSTVRRALSSALFKDRFSIAPGSIVVVTSEGVYQALKTLDGYLACVPVSRTVVESFPAVPLSIGGMEPRLANVPYAKYPAAMEYGVLFQEEAAEEVVGFANHLVSVDGMHAVASLGLVPAVPKLSLESCHCRATEGIYAPSGRTALAGQFVLAVVPELGTVTQESRYSGIARVIAEEFGTGIRLQHMESYRKMLQEFVSGNVDAAFVGSLLYAEIKSRVDVIPLARPESKGVSHYRGSVIVRADGPVRKFSDLRGKAFAYAPHTSAGELFALLLARRESQAMEEFFSRIETVPSHAAGIRLVIAGKVDGAAVKDTVLARMSSVDPSVRRSLRVIATSRPFPENSLIVPGTMSDLRRKKLLRMLLALNSESAGRAALRSLGADRFIPTADEDYANVFEVAREVGYRFETR